MNRLRQVVGIVIMLLLMGNGRGFSEQQYNAMENRWETVPDNSWSTQYNPMTNEWSQQPRGAKVEYNAMRNSWDWSSGHGNGED